MKKTLKVIMWIFIILMILGIGGCALSLYIGGKAVESVNDTITEMEENTKKDEELLKAMLDKAEPVVKKDEFSYTVEYTLVNDTGKDFEYIEVQYDVFDKDKVKLSNSFTNITDVKNGQTFKISLDLYEDGADTWEITTITATPFK